MAKVVKLGQMAHHMMVTGMKAYSMVMEDKNGLMLIHNILACGQTGKRMARAVNNGVMGLSILVIGSMML